MNRWQLDMGHGYWAYADADGTGRKFWPNGNADDITIEEDAELFAKIKSGGKLCMAPDEIVEGVKPARRTLTL